MALSLDALKVVGPVLRGARILSLGYPDLLLSADEAETLFGVRPTVFTDHGAWHKVGHQIPETIDFFNKLDASIDCIDIHSSRGVERIVDLNQPQDFGEYDLVIDAGTVEHCFNVGQAILSAANAVKTGGHIFHVPPMTMLNHGFYNLCPTLLWDFYNQNNWEIKHLSALNKHGWVDLHPTGRFRISDRAWMFCLAKRNTGDALKFPMQTKYLKNPNL